MEVPPSSEDLKSSEPPFLTFGKPDITKAEIDAVIRVMESRWLSTGPIVSEFEKEFEKYMGCGYAVALASCTDALRLSLMVASVGCGSEVITTPLTFAATANAIMSVDAKPVFVDVTPSGHMDPYQIEHKITNRTKAIIPVHYTGAACDMKEISEIATRHNLVVIEDAAHAFDGWYVGPMVDGKPGIRQRIGSISPFTCFSFYVTKNITCVEGGMVICRNKDLAERIKTVSMQGLSAGAWRRYGSGPVIDYEVTYAGQKANLSDLHAAVGLAQLRRWPEMKERRESIWRIYEDAFGLKEPGHAKHLFTIKHARRDALRVHLHEKGIGSGIHFKALHLEPGYAFMRHKVGDFPRAEKIGDSTVSLPLSSTMTENDAKRVVEAVKEFDK